jgi:putative Mg2+ transporter-C (MgtC) family protein
MQMVDMHLSIPEVALRLLLAMVMGGAIGYERQYKSRPAGLRTHILVCMGACVIALIQVEIATGAMRDALDHPDLAGVIRSDEARLIAQVVSGVGFLGAGTIIVTKRSVTGLTTAASLWAIAGLGIAIGMGFYTIALSSFIGIEDVNFDVKFMEDYRIYTNIYTIDLPRGLGFSEVIEELSVYKNVTKIRLVDIA